MKKYDKSESDQSDVIFHKGFWVQIGIILALVGVIFGMIQSGQATQDENIDSVTDDVGGLKIDTATIKQQNADIEDRLIRIENKLDALLDRGG